MCQVIGAPVGLEQVVRDRIFEFPGQRIGTRTLRMSSGQCNLCPLCQQPHVVDLALQNLSDLAVGQSGVAVQDDRNPLFVTQPAKVGDDRGDGGHARGPIHQLKALSVFPGQLDGPASGPYQGLERLEGRMLHHGQAPVELREDQLDEPLSSDRITREEVGRGLNERTFPVDHGGVLLVADRRHDFTSSLMVIPGRWPGSTPIM